MSNKNLPLVYSCSGCSSAAQTANLIAIKMDRQQIAEMSCIAGVGGDVIPLIKTAKSGRNIIAIDGCPLACCKHSLARHDVIPKFHFQLAEFDVPKKKGADPDPALFEKAYTLVLDEFKRMNRVNKELKTKKKEPFSSLQKCLADLRLPSFLKRFSISITVTSRF